MFRPSLGCIKTMNSNYKNLEHLLFSEKQQYNAIFI